MCIDKGTKITSALRRKSTNYYFDLGPIINPDIFRHQIRI